MAVRPEKSSIIVQTFLLQFFSRQSFQVYYREQINLAIAAAKGSKCTQMQFFHVSECPLPPRPCQRSLYIAH